MYKMQQLHEFSNWCMHTLMYSVPYSSEYCQTVVYSDTGTLVYTVSLKENQVLLSTILSKLPKDKRKGFHYYLPIYGICLIAIMFFFIHLVKTLEHYNSQ